MGTPAEHDRNLEIVRRRRAGETLNAIADDYNLTRQRVHAIIKHWDHRLDEDDTRTGSADEVKPKGLRQFPSPF